MKEINKEIMTRPRLRKNFFGVGLMKIKKHIMIVV